MSVNPSVRSSSSATYTGAPQIGVPLNKRTEVVSRASSPASSRRGRTRFTVVASEAVVRNRRRVYIIAPKVFRSRLQLAFDLVQKAPVRAIGNDLLRRALDRTQIVQP